MSNNSPYMNYSKCNNNMVSNIIILVLIWYVFFKTNMFKNVIEKATSFIKPSMCSQGLQNKNRPNYKQAQKNIKKAITRYNSNSQIQKQGFDTRKSNIFVN